MKSKRGEEAEGGFTLLIRIFLNADSFAFEIAFLCLLFEFISNFQHDTKHSYTIIDTILKVYLRYATLQFMLKSSPPPITGTTPSWL